MASVLREPLLHFIALGAVLFSIFAMTADEGAGSSVDIVVDDTRVAALTTQFRRLWQRPPSPEELQALVDGWVREEVLYREGVAMGLDRDDPVIRQRVAQKLAFISEDLMAVDPSDDELRAWLAEHADDYRIDPVLSFRQILVASDADEQMMAPVLADIRDRLARGDLPETLGEATLLPYELSEASSTEVQRRFGEGFADAVLGLEPGTWHGPLVSEFGLHLVQVTGQIPARMPDLDEVRSAVERDLVRARLDRANEAFMTGLSERYRIEVVSERVAAALSGSYAEG